MPDSGAMLTAHPDTSCILYFYRYKMNAGNAKQNHHRTLALVLNVPYAYAGEQATCSFQDDAVLWQGIFSTGPCADIEKRLF